jgi:hypothetical protein
MSEPKRNIFDDIYDGARRLWDEFERLLNPEKDDDKQDRIPVRIPVRPDRPNQDDRR